MSYGGELTTKVVEIKILKASKPTYWYADKVGKTVKARKRFYDGKPSGYYEDFYDRNASYFQDDIKEVNTL